MIKQKLGSWILWFGIGFLVCYSTLVNPDWYNFQKIHDSIKIASNECDLVIQEIEKYDWDVKVATAVMKAESKCEIQIKGDQDLVYEEKGREYGYSIGPFQIRILPGREHCDTYDVATNVACAYDIYTTAGRTFTDWTMFINNRYKNYL